MKGVSNEAVAGVLNENAKTVHKHKAGNSGPQTVCGLTNHVDPDQLRMTSIEEASTVFDVSKCGRCFEDGGGY